MECYSVTRLAKLKLFLGPSTANKDVNAKNSTDFGANKNEESSFITVRKHALAFRYKPRLSGNVSSSQYSSKKPPFELTLEYGPSRTGHDMDSEAMPVVLNSNNVGNGGASITDKYVTWENEGKVYFEKTITPQRWDTADYIAPITGAVLSKILDHVLEYSYLNPRYQPFEVFDQSRQITLVRSSSSEDFVWAMYTKMAMYYVDIRPILTPKRTKVRLYVDSKDDVQPVKVGKPTVDYDSNPNSYENNIDMSANVGREAVEFTENIYSCVSKILNSDYELFLQNSKELAMEEEELLRKENIEIVEKEENEKLASTNPQTNENANSVDESRSKNKVDVSGTESTQEADNLKSNENFAHDEHVPLNIDRPLNVTNNGDSVILPEHNDDDNSTIDKGFENSQGAQYTTDDKEEADDLYYDGKNNEMGLVNEKSDDNNDNYYNHDESVTDDERILKNTMHNKTAAPRADSPENASGKDVSIRNGTPVPTDTVLSSGTISVTNVSNFSTPFPATDISMPPSLTPTSDLISTPTTQPTNFTFVPELPAAVQATAIAMASSAQQDLLSGDGALMTAAIVPCLRQSHLGVQVRNNGTTAYLFVDGSTYFKLKLAHPFLEVVSLNPSMPTTRPITKGEAEFSDWVIVIVIATGFFVGIFQLVRKVMSPFPEIHNASNDMDLNWLTSFCFGENNKSKYQKGNSLFQNNDASIGSPRWSIGKALQVGGGSRHEFSQDNITSSVDGRSRRKPAMKKVNGVTVMVGEIHTFDYIDEEDENYNNDDKIEVEGDKVEDYARSVDLSSNDSSSIDAKVTRLKSSTADEGEFLFDNDSKIDGIELTSQRSFSSSPSKREGLVRDPDLVALPNLVSKTKVAMPVGTILRQPPSLNNSKNNSSDSVSIAGDTNNVKPNVASFSIV